MSKALHAAHGDSSVEATTVTPRGPFFASVSLARGRSVRCIAVGIARSELLLLLQHLLLQQMLLLLLLLTDQRGFVVLLHVVRG